MVTMVMLGEGRGFGKDGFPLAISVLGLEPFLPECSVRLP